MNKPKWYEHAGKDPFRRNQFHENLAASVRKRIGTEKPTCLHRSWLLGGFAAIVGIIVIFTSSFFYGNNPEPSIPPAANQPIENPVPEKSNEVFRMVDNKNGWAFGTSVKRTTDGGKTWMDRTPEGYDSSRVAPFPFNEKFAWIVIRPFGVETQNANWFISRTADGGDSWTPIPLPTKGSWSVPNVNTAFNLYFIDEKTGFFCFVSDPAGGPVTSAFYRTADSGQTWTYVNKIVPDDVLVSTPSDMSFSDHENGFITFYNPKDPHQPEVYRTTDAGVSWNRVLFNLPDEIKDALFIAEQAPIFFGKGKKEGVLSVSFMTQNNEKAGVIWFTTVDEGETWNPKTPQYSSPAANTQEGGAPRGFHAYAALDLKHFWMIDAETGTLYGSSDGGAHWLDLYTSPQLRNTIELKFMDEKNGLAQGDGFLLQTEDGGKSWKKLGD